MTRLTAAGKGFQISHYAHTHHVASLPPLDNGRYGPLGWDVIILVIVVGNSGFPCDILKEFIGQF